MKIDKRTWLIIAIILIIIFLILIYSYISSVGDFLIPFMQKMRHDMAM